MNETDNQPLEVMQPSAMMSIERAQIDSQVATAKQYPRELAKFKQRAVSMATLDGDTAESCVYCRPVGKGDDGKQKYAEGPSIRMAEIVATCYGNIRVASRIVEQTPRYVKCEGAAHDLETNFAAKAEVVESTVDRNGRPYSERQSALMAKVAVAKAFRDAVFKVVPRALMKPVLIECKKVIAKEAPTIAERIKRIQAWVATLKIDVKRVFAVLNVSDWSQFTEEQFDTLTGLKTAIADGDKIDDIFPPLDAPGNANAPAATAHQQAQAATTAGAATATMSGAQQAAAATQQRKTTAKTKQAAATPPPEEKKAVAKDEPAAAAAAQATNPNNVVKMPVENAPAAEPTTDEPDADLAAMGLAPETAAPETEADATPAAAEQAEPADDLKVDVAYAEKREGEDDAAYAARMLLGVNRLMGDNEITPEQFLAFAQQSKFANPGQKLSDLATKKLVVFIVEWKRLLPKIQKFIAALK